MSDYTDNDFAAMALAVWARNTIQAALESGEHVPTMSDHFPLEDWLEKLEDFKRRAAHPFSRQHEDPQYRMHQLQRL